MNERLAAVPGGIGAVIELTQRLSRQEGLPDARITTDVKHIEVGLTDKSDSIAYLVRQLAPVRAILPEEILIAGDEFGPIAGFEGSDYRMVTRLAAGATMVSVGREPNGVPTGVVLPRRRPGRVPPRAARADAPRSRRPRPALTSRRTMHPPIERAADGWAVERDGYDVVDAASVESLFALTNGYMGVRGATDEANPGSSRAAYVAGLFDGPEAGVEDLTVIADWTHTRIEIEGRSFRPWDWEVITHRRRLDLHTMALERTLRCVDPDGRRLRLESHRLVSLARRHLGAIRLRLVLEDGPGGARARSTPGCTPTSSSGRCRTSRSSRPAVPTASTCCTRARPAAASPSMSGWRSRRASAGPRSRPSARSRRTAAAAGPRPSSSPATSSRSTGSSPSTRSASGRCRQSRPNARRARRPRSGGTRWWPSTATPGAWRGTAPTSRWRAPRAASRSGSGLPSPS